MRRFSNFTIVLFICTAVLVTMAISCSKEPAKMICGKWQCTSLLFRTDWQPEWVESITPEHDVSWEFRSDGTVINAENGIITGDYQGKWVFDEINNQIVINNWMYLWIEELTSQEMVLHEIRADNLGVATERIHTLKRVKSIQYVNVD